MAKGLVYILTNPCLDGWVKIGMTERDDINQRLRELNAPTSIPFSYRCYATYAVDDPRSAERCIHSIIDNINSSPRARETLENGRVREREFFKMTAEQAYGVFKAIATLKGDLENLINYEMTQEEAREQEMADRRTKRSNSSFKLLNIGIGEEIAFIYDDTIKAVVSNDINQVEFKGEKYSVSALASKILIEKYHWNENTYVNGWRYFTKDNVALSDLRDKIESSNADD